MKASQADSLLGLNDKVEEDPEASGDLSDLGRTAESASLGSGSREKCQTKIETEISEVMEAEEAIGDSIADGQTGMSAGDEAVDGAVVQDWVWSDLVGLAMSYCAVACVAVGMSAIDVLD